MDSLENRLAECFSAVFPNRSREELVTASRESFAEWDSLAGVTLLTLLEEEFRLDFDLADVEHLSSFRSVLDYVAANVPAQGEPRVT
jgi:acyl carrier protein